MCNPAGARRQIIGVWRRELVERLAHVLAALGTERAWVVHGEDGLDEITLAGKTFVAEVSDNDVRTFELVPEDFGLTARTLAGVRGGDASVNAAIILDVLGNKRRDEARDLIVANSAGALFVGGKAETLREAASLADTSIESGAAQTKLEQLIDATNRT